MPHELAVVVVSDIHAGPDNNYDELRTGSGSPPSPRTVHHSIPKLAEAIELLLVGVLAKKRVLLCTGDLSTTCHSMELAAAGRALTQLAERLKVPKKQRFLLPGNHDIDWPLTKLSETDSWYDEYRQRKLLDGIRKHAPSFQFPVDGSPVGANLLGGAAAFYLLDSAHEDRANVDPHRGRLGPAQLAKLDAALTAAPLGAMKCVCLHHHVTAFAPTRTIPDFSLLEDAADLLGILNRHGVPMLFHGHQHYPHFQQNLRSSAPLTMVSAGSTTAPYKKLPESVPNTFHVVVFDDLHVSSPKGVVHTRMLTAVNGWQPPLLQHHFVAARRPFGALITQPILDAWADEIIGECQKEKLIRVDEFLASKPEGAHCCPHTFGEVVRMRLRLSPPAVALKLFPDASNDELILQLDSNGGRRR